MQRCIQLAVLDQFNGFGKWQIFGLAEIVIAHAGRRKDLAGIEFCSRLRGTNRKALALEIGKRLDARLLRGDDLDIVGINRSNAAQLVERSLEAGFRVAFPGKLDRVTQRQRQFTLALLQQVEVFDRCLG